MIIWNDYKYGEEIYNNSAVKTKKWQYKELKTLVLYMVLNDFKPKDIRTALNDCCQDDIKYLKEKQKTYIFNKLINQVKSELPKKEDLIKEDYVNNKTITIYKGEIEKIKALNNQNLERVAFVLLVYCKWLNNIKWFGISKSDIFYEAKLSNLNSENQQNVLSKLFELGYVSSDVIKINKKYCRGLKDAKQQMWSLTYLESDGEIAFQFNDYNNFVFRYLNYVYGGYFECAKCGQIYKQNKSCTRIYCKECALEVKQAQDASNYQPIETKTVVCKDCGKEFRVDGIVKNKTRCDECQKKYIRKLKTEKQREYRNK